MQDSFKKWGMIATWRMALEGVTEASLPLAQAGSARDAVLHAVQWVEDFPFYKSVGYGGLPNENGVLEMDAGYMDGTSLAVGAVASIRDVANPILIAERLSQERFNSVMVGENARHWALAQGFAAKRMLTERAQQHYLKRKQELMVEQLSSYAGHDTVGIVALDQSHNIVVGTSTSGLFMKRAGRVGDSPLVGSGFYADSEVGAATATGVGEDLMKGCISYEIVRRMSQGMSPQHAAESALYELEQRLKTRYGCVSDLSVVCMNRDAEFGVATNIDNFSFTLASYCQPATVYVAQRIDKQTTYQPATTAWLEAYAKRIRLPIN